LREQLRLLVRRHPRYGYRRIPAYIRCDNGPELTAEALKDLVPQLALEFLWAPSSSPVPGAEDGAIRLPWVHHNPLPALARARNVARAKKEPSGGEP
jgi:hypothetical protein